jgi:cytidylate kinase
MSISDAEVPVLTVDGPNASGKGSLCQMLASSNGWHLLDSGALYRLVALKAARDGVATDNAEVLAKLARNLSVRFVPGGNSEPTRVILDTEDVSAAIRTEACGADASKVAVHREVREALLELQRNFRAAPGLVADGRDMGTVVFPAATLKIFLSARPEVRAQRRYKQLMEQGIDVNLAALSVEVAERDRRDREREIAPLLPANDAIEIDTSDINLDAVFDQVSALMRSRGLL